LPYLDGRNRVAAYGVQYPKVVAVRTTDDVRRAATGLAAPYVLKAGWLEHKTDVGGVVIGLDTPEPRPRRSPSWRNGSAPASTLLEEMDRRGDVVELIVGARRDRSFGPLVLVGLGGVQAEVYRDVQLALAPVTERQAQRMIESLRAYPLLQGCEAGPSRRGRRLQSGGRGVPASRRSTRRG
jgi:Acyl-CoA synthetase (NDP forming)